MENPRLKRNDIVSRTNERINFSLSVTWKLKMQFITNNHLVATVKWHAIIVSAKHSYRESRCYRVDAQKYRYSVVTDKWIHLYLDPVE